MDSTAQSSNDDVSPKSGLSVESVKQLLERLLSSKSDRLEIKANDKGKNRFMWSKFDIAYLDGVEQQYACCKFCKGFVKYTGRTGTGGLMRHFCYKQFVCLKENAKNASQDVRTRSEPQNTSSSNLMQLTTMPSTIDIEKIPLRLQIETLIQQKSPRIGYIPNYKGKSGVWSQFYMITLDDEVVNFACCITCHSIVTYVSRTGTGSMTRHRCQNSSTFKRYFKNLEGDVRSSAPKKSKPNSEDEESNVAIKTEEPEDWETKKIKEEEEEEEEREGNVEESEVEDWREKNYGRQAKTFGNGNNSAADLGSKQTEENRKKWSDDQIPPEVKRLVQEKHLAFLKKSLNLLEMFQNDEFVDFAQTLIDLGAQYGKVNLKKILKGDTDFFNAFKKWGNVT